MLGMKDSSDMTFLLQHFIFTTCYFKCYKTREKKKKITCLKFIVEEIKQLAT